MTLFEALYHGALARIDAQIDNLSGPVLQGSMKSLEDYRKQVGTIDGLRQAKSLLKQEFKALTQPKPKPAETQET